MLKYEQNHKLLMPPGHITTFSGKVVNLFNPDPKDILLEDIAHGLAHNCRWNGHTKTFFSVAEHSVKVARALPENKQLIGLFHDAEEAYWGDIVSPLKALLPENILRKIVEFRQVIFVKFDIAEIDDEVNAADTAQMYWDYEHQIKSFKHTGITPLAAKKLWLTLATNLLPNKRY
ncbi:MAG TPA: hypothetical protein VEA37_05425 [Flavobacterium sp.]|nr:hypothetical protein [Flavobacterium sp.]